MNILRNLLKGFIFLNICVGLLLLVNLIPLKNVESNLLESVEYYKENEMRVEKIQGLPQSTDDTITDTFILNIIWFTDSSDLFRSTLRADYYLNEVDTFGKQLSDVVEKGIEYNASYARYWHGYNVLVRPLLILFNMNQIKVVLFVVFCLLLGYTVTLSKTKGFTEFGVILVISFILGSVFFEFFTIGHVAPLFISLIGCIFILKKRDINCDLLFFGLGITVAFFDFLSTETLTATLPLICYLILQAKYRNNVEFRSILKWCIWWCTGYGMTFIYKWILVFVVCGKEYLTEILAKGVEKFVQEASLFTALSLNIQMLFPYIKHNNIAVLLGLCLIGFLFCIIFVFRKKEFDSVLIKQLGFIACIPYLRYVILSFHSFVHYFFTYRAQVTSIFIVVYLLYYLIDFNYIKRIIKK